MHCGQLGSCNLSFTAWVIREFFTSGTTQMREVTSLPYSFRRTGFGQHADYVFGWEGDSLQRAMDQCHNFGGPCPTLKTQTVEDINKCTQKNRVREPVDGGKQISSGLYPAASSDSRSSRPVVLPELPGCNPIQPGPARATTVPNCSATKDYDADGGPMGEHPLLPPTSSNRLTDSRVAGSQ